MVNPSPAERKQLADLLGIAEQYLYQILSGRRTPDPVLAVRIEQATAGAVRRQDLRPNDWRDIWPELKDAEGAPEVEPQQQAA